MNTMLGWAGLSRTELVLRQARLGRTAWTKMRNVRAWDGFTSFSGECKMMVDVWIQAESRYRAGGVYTRVESSSMQECSF